MYPQLMPDSCQIRCRVGVLKDCNDQPTFISILLRVVILWPCTISPSQGAVDPLLSIGDPYLWSIPSGIEEGKTRNQVSFKFETTTVVSASSNNDSICSAASCSATDPASMRLHSGKTAQVYSPKDGTTSSSLLNLYDP